jgi:hypothetical protein
MNCSCTQTKDPPRAKPRFTVSWSGATETGLVFWISKAVTGGPPRSVRVAGKDRSDARLIEHPDRRVAQIVP